MKTYTTEQLQLIQLKEECYERWLKKHPRIILDEAPWIEEWEGVKEEEDD